MGESAIHGALEGPKEGLAARLKAYLVEVEAGLRARHLSGEPGTSVCRSYTGIIDELLTELYSLKCKELGCGEGTAMVAIGGYGRGELNMRSDIDLMLLYKGRITPTIERLTQEMLYLLWDLGFVMGFSIRSVPECIALAREDIKTSTSLLDRRTLTGDAELFEKLNSEITKKLFNRRRTRGFIDDKLAEQRQRHARYGGTVYILEPNVKEGEGGLRDLHSARWIISAMSGGTPIEPFSLGLISEKGEHELQEAFDKLLWVRNELHFNTGRKADQLSFDHQERIARLLGFKDTPSGLAVEAFMQRYYQYAANLSHYSELMLSRHLHREVHRSIPPREKVRLDAIFELSDGLLAIGDPEAFAKEPSAIMLAFEHLSAHPEARLDQTLKDEIIRFYDAGSPEFMVSAPVAASFMRILRSGEAFRVLGEMHALKFLTRYIPEFGDITCKVQHDMYHIYTVDTHTLFAVRELERLSGDLKGEFAVHASIYEELADPGIMVLAILFHDIGKAYGKGHAEKGAEMMPLICERLHLSDDDTELLTFLVANHLILANTAQHRDLHDDKLIVEFAKTIGDMERLNLLYLLTFTDVRAVGPDVWSQWKGALFQELYFKALTVLERGTFEIEKAAPRIERTMARVEALLAPEGIDAETVARYFDLLPQRYFLSNGAELIAGHLLTYNSLGTLPYVMDVRQDPYREYTELVICTHDVHALFSMITGVMAANGVSILGAKINTLRNGLALDILQVTSQIGDPLVDDHLIKRIEADLSGVLTGRTKVSELVGKKARPSILDTKHRPGVPTRVKIDNEVSDAYTVMDVHAQNRLGLLYDITRTLSELGLFIHIAKISTKGEAADDIFYVKDIFGQKIFYSERLKEISQRLEETL